MTDRVNETGKNKEELSDDELYELEWGEDEDSDGSAGQAQDDDDSADDDGSDDSYQEKAESEDTASQQSVAEGEGTVPRGVQQPAPAEGQADDDPWANVPAELRQAYLNAQNGLQAMKGRERAVSQKARALEKELEATRGKLSEATRQKGPYETNHPELFEEVRKAMGYSTPSTPQASQTKDSASQDGGDDDLEAVYRIHPDAPQILQSEEWAAFEKSMSTEQKQQYSSPDPLDFISLVQDFKIQRAARAVQATAKDRNAELLAAADAAVDKGTSSRADRNKTRMTDDEAYDAEWERED